MQPWPRAKERTIVFDNRLINMPLSAKLVAKTALFQSLTVAVKESGGCRSYGMATGTDGLRYGRTDHGLANPALSSNHSEWA